jgi:2,4-dienoyl-CoA reductase-like NADH-dependent reductase (Old Yellow Enzyme family)
MHVRPHREPLQQARRRRAPSRPCAVKANVSLYTDAAGMQPCDEPEPLSAAGIAAVIADYAHGRRGSRRRGRLRRRRAARHQRLPADAVPRRATPTCAPTATAAAPPAARASWSRRWKRCRSHRSRPRGPAHLPGNPFNDVVDHDPVTTYTTLLEALRPLRYAYLHVIAAPGRKLDAFALARAHCDNPLIVNDGYEPDDRARGGARRRGEAVSFGRHYVGNPDLVERICRRTPAAPFDRKTLYTPGAKGYTDYPRWQPA